MQVEVADTGQGQAPRRCPYGHALTPGVIQVSWSPCDCPPALDGARGHRTWACDACRAERRATVAYWPPHLPADGSRGRHPGRW